MRIAYLDCFAGISGDMLLGALVDAGVPYAVLEQATAALKLGASLRFEIVDRSGISATKVHVLDGDSLAEQAPANETVQAEPKHQGRHAHPHSTQGESGEEALEIASVPESQHGRPLSVILALIQDADLHDDVKALATRTFELLGHAEARIHNVPVGEIHFHEVGGVDAIVDIVAASAGLVHLAIDAWHCSPVNVGSGMVRCAHGIFPVPAPATADLLRGTPTYSAHVQKELVTPTGAALLRALDATFGSQPHMVVAEIGYGAGTRNPADFPNVLRLSIGQSGAGTIPVPGQSHTMSLGQAPDTTSVLEVALDDITPQVLAYVTEQALQMGALDVMLTPVIMKKGRPGTLLTILVNPEDESKFERMIFRETTTLGLRKRRDRRSCLERSLTAFDTPYGPIRVKIGSLEGAVVNANPEFEDCRRAAEANDVPLKQVQAAAIAAYRNAS